LKLPKNACVRPFDSGLHRGVWQGMSATARTLERLRELGYQARGVEKWNPYAKIRQDLFGGDLLALKPGEPVLVVQCTTGANVAARIAKLQAHGYSDLWKSVGP